MPPRDGDAPDRVSAATGPVAQAGIARRSAGPRGKVSEPPPRPLLAAIVRAILVASGRLPLRVAHAIGAAAGSLLWLLPTREARVTRENLARAFPDLPPRARARLARESLAHLGRMASELGLAWTADPARALARIRRVEGEDVLASARSEGRGVLIAAPHLGSWEMVLLHLSAHHGMTTLYRPPRVRELDAFVRRARERSGGRLLAPGPGMLREMIASLRAGGTCGIACDQDPGEGAGVFVPFLGEVASTMILPGRLASSTGALIVVAVAERLPRGEGFVLRFERASEAAHDSDPAVAAAALNADLERAIRRLPSQYLWSYRRHRIRPPSGHGGRSGEAGRP